MKVNHFLKFDQLNTTKELQKKHSNHHCNEIKKISEKRVDLNQ
jgi:hypothetical protein